MAKFNLDLGGKELIIELRNLAEQANGSCFVRLGDTMVMATAVMSAQERKGMGFFPLTVDYEERYYAAGKIRGPRYIKRESRPSDEAILVSRLIDRSIRPLFPKQLQREAQAIITCLSWDSENDPDIPGLVAASTALSISDIPWQGPLGAVRVGKVNGDLVLNPTYEQREKSELDIVFCSVEKNNKVLINMMEAGGQEVEESVILKAFEFAEPYVKKIIDFQKEITKEVGRKKMSLPEIGKDPELEKEAKKFLAGKLEEALFQKDKQQRYDSTGELKAELLDYIHLQYPDQREKLDYAADFFNKEVDRTIHENIIHKGKRPDGRKIDELREISCEVGLLPRTHGSGLFVRGQTKALSILTLGAPGDQQILEGMEIVGKKRFMHHYNFPPYSAGEIKPMRGPGRREIGHGILAEKTLLPLIPGFESFPYTIRIVTEILSSNGSTSQAAVSASSLALMDAGVPVSAAAAGIAIGLMSDEKGNYKVLTDIQGPEDHHGDMDFKVGGTRKGITAIQMDVKIEGITREIMEEALAQAKNARLKILDIMEKAIASPRPDLSPFAPRIIILQISPDKIREVIGPRGKIINEIIEETGVTIDIHDSGMVFITSEKEEAAQKAVAIIQNITREVKAGEIFQGRVTRILDFGAFVEILPNQEGLVHISQLAPYRVGKVEDVVKIDDVIPVKVISIDERGRINLSLKEAQNHHDKNNERSHR